MIQHNGGGTVVINDFTVSDFGKLYRSCGNCDEMPERHVKIVGGSASDGSILVGINSNMGDTASISGMTTSNVESECIDYEGVTDGSEPEEVGTCDASGSGSTTGSSTTAVSTPAATTAAAQETTSTSSDSSSDDDEEESGDDDEEESGDDDEEESNDDDNDDDEEESGDDDEEESGDDDEDEDDD